MKIMVIGHSQAQDLLTVGKFRGLDSQIPANLSESHMIKNMGNLF